MAEQNDTNGIKGGVKPHISYSQLDMFWRCPEQYRRRYIEKELSPPGIALLQGTGLHRGAEGNFRQKIETRSDLPKSEIVDMAVAAFEEAQAGGYSLSEEESSVGADKTLGEAKDQLVRLAEVHAQEQAPEYQPTSVEHSTRIIFPNATHDLLAVTDLRDDRDRVTDFKTAARKKPENEVHSSIQLTIYAAAFQIDVGRPPSEVRLDVLTKTKNPSRQLLRSDRTRPDFQALVNRVNVTLAAINSGNFPPASPGAWCCSPRWCGFWSTCRFVNPERSAKAQGDE